MRAPKKILGALAGISMLATTLGIGSAAFAASPTYYDIYDLTTLAQTAANGLYQAGIMNGTAPGKFSPAGVVTRAQAVKFVVNLSGVKLQYPRTASYSDVTSGSQYYPYIETALADGFLTGYAGTSGAFDPSAPVTRIDLAILVVNALGDQSVAQSMATDTTTYAKFTDLNKVPAGDLGYANAGMKLGFVPPLNATLYFPNGKVNREQLAVGLWRGYEALQAGSPASLKIASSPADVGIGQAANLSVTATNKAGTALTASELSGYTVTYTVTGSNASSASVSSNGVFVATAAGNYTVEASISGGVLSAPVTGTLTVGVYGTPTALKVAAATTSLVADGVATDAVTVTAVDANGIPVGNYNGAVTLTDTGSATSIQTSATTVGNSDTVNAANGVATFTVQSVNDLAGVTDTLAATATNNGTALTEGTATVQTTAQVATSIAVSAASKYLTANVAGNTDAISATVDDQAGNPMLTGQYALTFQVSGPATLVNGATSLQSAFFGSGNASVTNSATESVYSEAGATGTVTVTVSATNTAENLKGGSTTVSAVISGVPAALSVSAVSSSIAAGAGLGAPDAVTIGVNDANGHPTTVATSTAVNLAVTQGSTTIATFTATIPAGQGSTTVNLVSPSANQTVPATEIDLGTMPGNYTVTASGSYSPGVSATATTLASANTTVAITAGSASGLSLSPTGPNGTEIDVPYTAQTVAVTAQVTDASGNAVNDSGVAVTFALTGSGTASINGSATSATPSATATTNANGVATANLAFTSSPGAVWDLTATALVNGASQSSRASFDITATPAGAVSVSMKDNQNGSADFNSPSAALSGDAISGTINVNQSNGLAIGQVDQVVIDVSPATALTGFDANGVTVNDGTAGEYVVPTSGGVINFTADAGAAGTFTVTAKDESLVNPITGTASMVVTPSGTVSGAAAFSTNGMNLSPGNNTLQVSANTPVAITVSPVDAAGDPILDANALTVGLADQAPTTLQLAAGEGPAVSGGSFRTAPSGATITSVTIPADTPSETVYYVNASSGQTYITASTASVLTAAALGASQPTVANPTTAPTVSASSTTPTALAAGNYLVQYAYKTTAGDTLPSPFSQVTLSAGQAIDASAPALPAGATGIQWYVSVGANQTTTGQVAGTSVTVTLSTVGNTTPPFTTDGATLPAPTAALTPGTASTGGSIAASTTVYVTYAFTNANGSTTAAPAGSVTTGSSTSTNTVYWTAPTLEAGATGVTYYAGTVSGTEYQVPSTDLQTSGSTVTLIAVPTTGTASSSLTNTATLSNPSSAPTTSAVAGTAANSSLTSGTYWVSYAWYVTNTTTTTVAAPATAVGVSTGQNIDVTLPTKPAAATGADIYLSNAVGSTTLVFETSGTGTTFTLTAPPAGGAAAAPTTNTTPTITTLDLTFSNPVVAAQVTSSDLTFAGATPTVTGLVSGSGTTVLVVSYTGTITPGTTTVAITANQTDIKTVSGQNVAGSSALTIAS